MNGSFVFFIVFDLAHVFYDFEVSRFFPGLLQLFSGMCFGLPVRKAHRSREKNIHPGYFSTAPGRQKSKRAPGKKANGAE